MPLFSINLTELPEKMPKLYLIEEYLSFRESLQFSKKLKDYLTDENYFELQEFLLADPTKGDIIQGGGGLRKIRWRASGRGKAAAFGLFTIWRPRKGIFIFWIFTPKTSGKT